MTSSSITQAAISLLHYEPSAHLMSVTLYTPYEKWIGLVQRIHEAMQ
jgi:hypothetical protein